MKTYLVIEQILKNNPETRNDDRLLSLKVCEAYGLYMSRGQQEKWMNMPALESIPRLRRKIQGEGRYEATAPIKQARKLKSLEIQQRMPGTKLEETENIITRPVPLFELQPGSTGYVH